MELRDVNAEPQESNAPPSSVTALIQSITSNMSVFGYNDEYDPLKPNDYEKLKEQRKREQYQRDQDTERKQRDDDEPRGLYDDGDDNESDERTSHGRESNERAARKGNVFAPPPSLIEEDKRASSGNQNDQGQWHGEKHASSDVIVI